MAAIFVSLLISFLRLNYKRILSKKKTVKSTNLSKITNLSSSSNSIFAINVWYGSPQNFGHLGNPQRFINILGNISTPDDMVINSASYRINGSDEIPLTLGLDKHRLAEAGDFNIEINLEELFDGENNVIINAINSLGKSISEKVVVNYTSGKQWSLPYSIDFAEVIDIQDVAQIVDGKWTIENGGARTIVSYYDRVLAFGEMNWENYEVTTEVTINDFTPPFEEPPSYNVTHFGIGARWKGHHDDGYQPRRKWYPLGAAMEFTLSPNLDKCHWRMFGGGLGEETIFIKQKKGKSIELNKRYIFKMRVKTQADSSTLYQMKMWSADQEEPIKWDLEQNKTGRNYRTGSIVLAAHHTDVTIWKVNINPL